MTFQTDLSFGERAESIFVNWLQNKGLEPIRNIDKTNKYFDILVPARTYEIKSDRYDNGNIAVELMSNKNLLKLGWFYYSAANTLIYFLTQSTPFKYLEIDMNYLRKFVEQNRDKYPLKITGESESTNLIIPYKDFEKDKCKLKIIL